MKKSTLAIAILTASVTTSAVAAPTLYGNFRYSVGNTDSGTADTSGYNNASRVGIKGSETAEGVTGYYHIQMGANADAANTALSQRFYFAGIKGDFGDIRIGKLSHPYKMAAVSGGFDPFYDTSAGASHSGSSFGTSNDTNGFTDNSVFYYGKSGAISFNAGLMFDEANTDKDGSNFGVKYSADGMSVGVQTLSKVGSGDKATRLHGTYNMGGTKLSASYETIERSSVKGNLLFLGVKAGSIIAQIGSNTGDLTGSREKAGTGFSIGYVSKLTKSTKVTAMFSSVDYKDDTSRKFTGVQLVQSF